MQINPILWLYALRLGQVVGSLGMLLAPIMLFDAVYAARALPMVALGTLLLSIPYTPYFGKIMQAGYEGSNKRNGAGDNGETRQTKRQRQRQERKFPRGIKWRK